MSGRGLKDLLYMQVTMPVTSQNLHCNVAWPKLKDFCNDKCYTYDTLMNTD